MNYEKLYYEDPAFWSGQALQDEFNNERIRETLQLVPAGISSMADIGCGNGVFLKALQRERPSIDLLGVERSETAISYVSTRKLIADITSLPLDDRSYECASALEVLEHIKYDEYHQALSELARITSKYLLISVPYDEALDDNMNRCPGCLSMINRDLHFRSYNEPVFKKLFSEWGFECTAIKKAGIIRQYKYHHLYRKLSNPDQYFQWSMPVCPVCGYIGEDGQPTTAVQPEKSGFRQALKKIPKALWPQTSRYYWIIGLFTRSRS